MVQQSNRWFRRAHELSLLVKMTLKCWDLLQGNTQVISEEAAEDVRKQEEGTTFEKYMAAASDEDYMAMSALKAQADAGDDEAYADDG